MEQARRAKAREQAGDAVPVAREWDLAREPGQARAPGRDAAAVAAREVRDVARAAGVAVASGSDASGKRTANGRRRPLSRTRLMPAPPDSPVLRRANAPKGPADKNGRPRGLSVCPDIAAPAKGHGPLDAQG